MTNDCHFSARPLHFLGNGLLLYREPLNFYYLKKALLILSIILLTTTASNAQDRFETAAVTARQTPILRTYPNPATTVITFDFQRAYNKGYTLQVYHMLGRKMLEQTNLADQTTIQLTDFARGVYVYHLIDRTGKVVETGKFQVSK